MMDIYKNNRRIKVLHMIDHFGIGGAQSMLVSLLENHGPDIDASLCILSDRMLPSLLEGLRSAGIASQPLRLSKFNPMGLLRLRAAIQKENPDILHTHLQYSSIYGAIAAVSLGRDGPLIVDHIHSNPLKIYTVFQRISCRLLAPAVKAHIAVSAGLKRSAQKSFKGQAQTIRIIPPGLNLNNFNNGNYNASGILELRKGAKRVVGLVGRMAKEKSVHIFLAAVPALLADEPDTRILIIGEGPLLKTLKCLAKNLGIAHAVTFTGYRSDVGSAYKAMDVFVLSSQEEGCSLAVIEAMASRVPVVITDTEGARDIVMNNKTGIIVPLGDSDAIASAVLKLFNEPDLKQTLADNAFAAVHETYDVKRMTAKIESLYREIISNHRKPQELRSWSRKIRQT